MATNKINRYTFTIDVTASGGCKCTNPSLELLSNTENISVNCVGGCKYEVSSINELKDQCLVFLAYCEEGCGVASQEIEVCFCSQDSDCGACEKCTNGVCVSKCPDKVCKNNQCVDCFDNSDCGEGFICTNGGCFCPSGIVVDGKCVECDANSILNPCEICIDGKIVAKDCGEFVCNPKTGECTQCVEDSHCTDNEDGRNCCVSGKCDCCEGYVYDLVLGRCKEAPECTDSDDCSACKNCVGGKCVDVICPEDHVCDPLQDKCVYNPCFDKSCENGADCGEDCGCLDKKCVPCYQLDCENETGCTGALGCECSTLNNCLPAGGCSGTCTVDQECGTGCKCYGGICTPCSNFEGNDCAGGSGCNDTFNIKKESCKLTATFSSNSGCSCSPITIDQYVKEITTSTTGTTIKADFFLRKGLADNHVEATGLPVLDESETKVSIADNEEPTSGSIQVEYTISYTRTYIDSFGNNITESDTLDGTVTNGNLSFGGVGRRENASLHIPYKVGEPFGGLSGTTVTQIEVRTVAGDFTFPNNCVYDKNEQIHEFLIRGGKANADSATGAGYMISESTRNPLFVWYKSTNGTYPTNQYTSGYASGIFRKVYVSSTSNGVYKDTLLGPDDISADGIITGTEGELWSNYYYQVWVDCGCGVRYADAGKVVFCDPKDYTGISFSECNTKVTLAEPFSPCKVNSFRKLGNWDSATLAPKEVQVYYTLVLVGEDSGRVEKGHFVKMGNNMLKYDPVADTISNTSMFTSYDLGGEKILRAEIIHIHDKECVSDKVAVVDNIIPIYTLDECADDTSTYKIRVKDTVDGVSVTSVAQLSPAGGENFVHSGGFYTANLTKNKVTKLKATFSNGCSKEFNVEDNCTFTIDIVEDEDGCAGNELSVDKSQGVAPYTYQWSTGATSSKIVVSTSNTVSVTVTDAIGQVAQDSITPAIADAFSYTLTDSEVACVGDSGEIEVLFTPINVATNGVLNISANSGPTQSVTNVGGKFVIAQIPKTNEIVSEYYIDSYEVGECTYNINETRTFSVVDTPTVISTINPPSPLCPGTDVTIALSGTNGIQVQVTGPDADDIVTIPGNLQVTAQSGINNYTFSQVGTSSCPLDISGTTSFTALSGPVINSIQQECSVDWTTNDVTVNTASAFDNVVIYDGFTPEGSGSSNTPITITQTDGATRKVIVTATNGCSVEQEFTLTTCDCDSSDLAGVLDDGAGTVLGNPHQINAGDTITIRAVPSGGSGSYTYQWNNGGPTTQSISVTPSASTSYSVVVSDGNCDITLSVNVVVLSNCSCFLNAAESATACSIDISMTGTGCGSFDNVNITGPNGVDIDLAPGALPVTQDVSAGGNGNYTVTLSDSTETCSDNTSVVTVSSCDICPDCTTTTLANPSGCTLDAEISADCADVLGSGSWFIARQNAGGTGWDGQNSIVATGDLNDLPLSASYDLSAPPGTKVWGDGTYAIWFLCDTGNTDICAECSDCGLGCAQWIAGSTVTVAGGC